MSSWDKIFKKNQASSNDTDYLKQVGHTVDGKSINQHQFNSLVNQITKALELSNQDVILDLCCGNGVFTKELAKNVSCVIGVDNCAPLLEVAKHSHSAANIQYQQLDAMNIDALVVAQDFVPTKILIYAAVQHFSKKEFKSILRKTLAVVGKPSHIFIGFIPDGNRKWLFYNTLRRRIEHIARKLSGNDNFGRWWTASELAEISNELGFRCKITQLPESTHASIYRFNSLFTISELNGA